MIIDFFKALGNEFHFAVLHAVDGGLSQRLHLDEPLLGNARLNDGGAAVAGADIVLDRLYLEQVALLVQVFDNLFSRIQTVHPLIFAAVFIDDTGLVHHIDDGQIVAQTDLEVVRVVGRGDLYHAGSEIRLYIRIRNDWDLFADQRQNHSFADQVPIALVVRMHRHSGVAQHGFGAGRREADVTGAVAERVAQVPEAAVVLAEVHLRVGNGSTAVRAPVDDALAAVNQALFIQAHEYLANRFGAALVERKALTLPVAGTAELFELADDGSAVFFFPVPRAAQKALAADFFLSDALFAHGLYDLCLRRDGGVVGTRQPQSRIALHSAPADQNIL